MEDEHFIKIKNARLNVERIVHRIERVQSDTQEDAMLTVTKRWNQQTNNYRDYVNLLLDSMRVSNNANQFTIEMLTCTFILFSLSVINYSY